MKVKELLENISKELSEISTEPLKEAEIILTRIANLNKTDFIFNSDVSLGEGEYNLLKSIVIKRNTGLPIQYIFNEQYFRDFLFYVDERVLIPRPETEILVDKTIEMNSFFSEKDEIKILDIGTGSGAIAISLALEIKNSVVYSVDLSESALEVAEINKKNLKVPENKLFFMKSDLFSIFQGENPLFDIIVSNPPYIPYEQYINLEKSVLKEPRMALLGNDYDGLGFYREILSQMSKYVSKDSFILFETGFEQAQKVAELMEQKKLTEINIFKDYNNINRIVSGRLKI